LEKVNLFISEAKLRKQKLFLLSRKKHISILFCSEKKNVSIFSVVETNFLTNVLKKSLPTNPKPIGGDFLQKEIVHYLKNSSGVESGENKNVFFSREKKT